MHISQGKNCIPPLFFGLACLSFLVPRSLFGPVNLTSSLLTPLSLYIQPREPQLKPCQVPGARCQALKRALGTHVACLTGHLPLRITTINPTPPIGLYPMFCLR